MTSTDKSRNGKITRRDFLHDLSLASLALSLPSLTMAQTGRVASEQATYYPPTLTGMRGAHAGAFEVAHQLAREGKAFENPQVLDEHYDLVIVGAGISGLAAAYFYRREHGPRSKILLLDNHDDFGGHAKRNEFHQGGAMRLAWGGTVNIEYPNYSDVGLGLLQGLGIDIPRLLKGFDYNWGDNGTDLSESTWFDRETYGADVLIPGLSFSSIGRQQLLQSISRFPISDDAKTALTRFLNSQEDALSGSQTMPYRYSVAPPWEAGVSARTIYRWRSVWSMVCQGSTYWGCRSLRRPTKSMPQRCFPMGTHRLPVFWFDHWWQVVFPP
jgi:spermidine dehydrogenase